MKRISLVLAVLAIFGARDLSAQSQTVSASIEVPVTLSLNVSGSLAFNTTAITAADFTTGYRQSSTDITVSHNGNVPHVVKVSGSAATLSFTPLAGRSEANPNKPISDLVLSTNSFTSSIPLSSTVQTLVTQATPAAGTATVKARMNLGYASTPPGTYSTVVTFTVAES